MFHKNDYMFTFDLKSAYHHISIFESHRQYLGFTWDVSGKTKYFVYFFLPFGISSATFIFTKVMRSVIKYWRGQGIRAICFIDDGIVGGAIFNMLYRCRVS